MSESFIIIALLVGAVIASTSVYAVNMLRLFLARLDYQQNRIEDIEWRIDEKCEDMLKAMAELTGRPLANPRKPPSSRPRVPAPVGSQSSRSSPPPPS